MSIRVMNHVWTDSPAKGSELLILLAIADFANDEGVAWPGVETLAKKARLSKRQTQYNLRSLAKSGLLSILENAGPHGAHLYRIEGCKPCTRANPAPVQSATDEGCNVRTGGAIHGTEGVQPIAPEPSVEPSLEPSGEPSRATTGKTKPKKAKAHPTPTPDSFEISDRLREWAPKHGYTVEQMEGQIDFFLSNHRMKGNQFVDWDAAFQNWMHRARQYGHLDDKPRPTPSRTGTADRSWRDKYLNPNQNVIDVEVSR